MIFNVVFTVFVIVLPLVISASEFMTSSNAEVNLTHWREYRRKKRFIIFENVGILKLSASISYPVDLGDTKPWRQLIMTYNLLYQFPLPTKPIYGWNNWNRRNLPGEKPFSIKTPEKLENYKDAVQELIYEFAEHLMDRKGMNGSACIQRAICENAQIHINEGLYAKIIHRILQPQRNLNSIYTEAWRLGKMGMNCQSLYPSAKKCLFDDYFHVREDFMQRNFVKDLGPS